MKCYLFKYDVFVNYIKYVTCLSINYIMCLSMHLYIICILICYLFENDSLPVESLCCSGHSLYLGWDSEAQSCQLPDLSQQGHQSITVVHPELAICVPQLHQPTRGLQA